MDILLIAIVVAVATMALMQWWISYQARRMQGRPLPQLPEPMAARLRERGKALLYFYSRGCGPCRAMTPLVERLSQQHDNVFLFDLSQDRVLAKTLRIMATPTVLVITPKTIETVVVGQINESRLRQLLA